MNTSGPVAAVAITESRPGAAAVAQSSEPRPGAARVWLLAARPQTLTASLVPVLVGTALAAQDGVSHAPSALAALGGALCIQIGTNLFNDSEDFKRGADTPDRLGPARATQRGWLSAGQVRRGAVIAFGLTAVFGLALIARAGWPVALLGVASVLSGLAYTGGPKPLAYVGLGDVFVMLFFGVGAVCGTYYVQALSVSLPALLASVSVGALATCLLVVNNLRDAATDARAAKRTLVVRLGVRFGQAEYATLLTLAYLIPAGVFAAGLGGPGWLLPLASLPLALREARGVFRSRGADLNRHLVGTARVGLLFGALLALGIGL